MKTNKKIRKLLRDPKQFFSDMLTKRLHRVSALPVTQVAYPTRGHYRYTVVSAVYNVEKYLDYYFRTLTRQTLTFTEHIQLVLVDDGSTDASAATIARWQARFPNNILYLHKENGGQASARNLGLRHVETEYVTFIDPDDFIAPDYFQVVDQFLWKNRDKGIRMAGCNLIFFREGMGSFSDTHPLRYRFAKGNSVAMLGNLASHLQLSAATAIFDAEIIRRCGLIFDERIRPSFEDAHFVGRFLALAGKGHVAFLKDACYYYRKRGDGTSTLDATWSNLGYFDEVLRFGCLGLISFYRQLNQGPAPTHIQRAILYHTVWQVRQIVNRPERLALLSAEQRRSFLQLLDAVFSAIDSSTIMNFELAGVWFYDKVGLLHCFQREEPPYQIVYIDAFDPVKKQVRLVYYTGSLPKEEFLIDGEDVAPCWTKTAHHDFAGRTFVQVRYVWLPVDRTNDDAELRIRLGGLNSETRITLAGKQYPGAVKIKAIETHFRPKNEFDSSMWLLMDREIQADDNAEHLYRHIRAHHPDQKIRFVLRKNSHDWARLKTEGFELLAYGSSEHESALKSCGAIISSHIDQYVVDYFRDGSLKEKSIVFLQHGVTKDDISAWLNPKKIDCFITASQAEYNSIAGDGSRYKFTGKEVVLTGMARHDRLLNLQGSLPTEKVIFIAPTWRENLSGRQIHGNLREANPDFMTSRYALAWRSFLCNPALRQVAERAGYRIEFFPHTNVQPYLAEFDLPPHITVVTHANGSMQDRFCRAALMITDFSSVAFEMALLEKPVLYFQFDREDFFSGGHTLQTGYFDYERDGFGPICLDEVTLLKELGHLLAKDGCPDALYLDRMRRFFAFHDGNNCERIYQAIRALDAPDTDPVLVRSAMKEHARSAERAGDWPLAERRWRQFLAIEGLGPERAEAQVHLAEALAKQCPSLLEDIRTGAGLRVSSFTPLAEAASS